MTIEAIINLLTKKLHYLFAGLLAGLLVGYSYFLYSPTLYEGKAFISIGTNWISENTATPAWDATQATEDFSETLIGIIKGANFAEKINQTGKVETNGCFAGTFEKGNLIINCQAKNESEAAKLSSQILKTISEIIYEYNQNTSTSYSIGYSTTSVNSLPPSLTKTLIAAGSLGFLAAALLVLLFAYFKKIIWHKSQAENLLGRKIAEINPETLEKISQNSKLVFLGKTPEKHKKTETHLTEIKTIKEEITIIINLQKTSYNDLLLLQEFLNNQNLSNIKLFTLK